MDVPETSDYQGKWNPLFVRRTPDQVDLSTFAVWFTFAPTFRQTNSRTNKQTSFFSSPLVPHTTHTVLLPLPGNQIHQCRHPDATGGAEGSLRRVVPAPSGGRWLHR